MARFCMAKASVKSDIVSRYPASWLHDEPKALAQTHAQAQHHGRAKQTVHGVTPGCRAIVNLISRPVTLTNQALSLYAEIYVFRSR